MCISEWKKAIVPTGEIENLEVRIGHGIHLRDEGFQTLQSGLRPLEMDCLRIQFLLVLILQLLLELCSMLTHVLPFLRKRNVVALKKRLQLLDTLLLLLCRDFQTSHLIHQVRDFGLIGK